METVFYTFSDTDSNRSNLLVHLHRIFQLILHSGYWKRFLVLFKPLALIQSFFLLVDTIHEIKSRPIFKEEQLFPASGSGVFIKSFITISLHESWVKFKPCAFISELFFCCWKALLKLGVN